VKWSALPLQCPTTTTQTPVVKAAGVSLLSVLLTCRDQTSRQFLVGFFHFRAFLQVVGRDLTGNMAQKPERQLQSSRACEKCGGLTIYKPGLLSRFNGKYMRICRSCGYFDHKAVRVSRY
jgi:hypothetical protein